MDERFLKEEGTEVFTGNELILKGALESGCALITGYPGSPVSDLFDVAHAQRDLLKKRGILADLANNEALAVARLNGSRMAGVRAMAVMKSVGLHVAADGLALGNLSEPRNAGGSIVVVGDDPWIDSTQINNDSRFLSQHLHMPVLEPATFQEMKDWVGVAFELSSAADLYVTYLVTTHQADGGGTVWVRPQMLPRVSMLDPVTLETSRIDLETNVLLPPRTWDREATLPDRFEKLLSEARAKNLNSLLMPSREPSRIGFISSGLSYCYLEHALSELGLSGRFPILKLGLTFPVDPQAVLKLSEAVDSIYVIEEKRGFIEQQVIQILHHARQASPDRRIPQVWGKKFPNDEPGIPEKRGINASILMEKLIPLFAQQLSGLKQAERDRLKAEQVILDATRSIEVELQVRTPTFCPGCPHRDSSSVFLEIQKSFQDAAYMSRVHDCKPLDLVFHGETGCFTMLMFEPNTPLMHNYSGMGLGGGTGAGADPFITNKQIVFLGDSTFFHSGMIAISDSIKAGQDITYVILDNKTTAMTGHQPTPGNETNLMGDKTFAQSIESIVQAMAGTTIPVHRVNPGYRDAYRELLEDAVLQEGVKIVIADKECGLTFHRRQNKEKKRTLRRDGFLSEEHHINVTPEVCEYCLECTAVTGCPGLAVEDTLYGPKITTDLTHCVSDGACAKVKACPSFEEVAVRRTQASHQALLPMEDLPMPASVSPDPSRPYYIFAAGVGGQGAGVISAVLVQAAQLEGQRVLFSDKKGLAIRNGGVYAHILITRAGGVFSPLIPYGKADVILGIDLLEAARGVDAKAALRVADPSRTSAVVNTAVAPTVRMLLGKDARDASSGERAIKSAVQSGGWWGENLSKISETNFGSQLYANMLLLGAAFQLGRLPFTLETLEAAIARSVPAEDRSINMKAFHAGRRLVANPQEKILEEKAHSYATLLAEKQSFLATSYGKKVAESYRHLVEEAVLELDADDAFHRDFALRTYDLIHYENITLARRYTELVLKTASRDRREWGWQATRAVLLNAFKVIAIKDEVYVSHLLTSPEKRKRDRARYRIDERRGDRLVYRHLNRPEFVLFGKRFRWDMVTQDWQLHMMKRMKFLRRLLPAWHAEEKLFRDWYLQLVDYFDADDEPRYRLWVQLLRSPEEVRGYREIRSTAMQKARNQAVNWIAALSEAAPALEREELAALARIS